MNHIEAMKQALEVLKSSRFTKVTEATELIGQAIADFEKEKPAAWQVYPFDYGIGHEGVYARTDRLEQVEAWKRKGWDVQPLYTRPQAKELA